MVAKRSGSLDRFGSDSESVRIGGSVRFGSVAVRPLDSLAVVK